MLSSAWGLVEWDVSMVNAGRPHFYGPTFGLSLSCPAYFTLLVLSLVWTQYIPLSVTQICISSPKGNVTILTVQSSQYCNILIIISVKNTPLHRGGIVVRKWFINKGNE